MADETPIDINSPSSQQYGPNSVDNGNIPQTTTSDANPDTTTYNKDVPAIQAEGTGQPQNGPTAPVQGPAQPQKPNQPNQVQPTQPNQAQPVHPSVQRASWVHDVAETLAGGPKFDYKTTVDPDTGMIKQDKVQVPVSGRHLAMAIALEALQGSLTGLAAGRGKGPGAAGSAAMNQQIAQQQAMKDRQQKQASADYARQAAIAQTNMHMAMNERALAQADISLHQRDVDMYAPLYDAASKANAIDKEDFDEAEAHKLLSDGSLHVTKDMIIPIKVVPKMNADGVQERGPNHEPLYEKKYALLKPTAQIDLPADVLKTLQDNKVPGYVDKDGNPLALPTSYRPRLSLVMDGMEKARTIQTGKSILQGLANKQVNATHPAAGTLGQPQEANPKLPPIKDENVANLLDTNAEQNGLNKSLVRAIASQESGGKAGAVNPKSGASGIMQLMPDTAKQYGVTDPLDPKQNIEAGTKYLADLLKRPDINGDIDKALKVYGGFVTQDPTAYINSIHAMAGTNATAVAPSKPTLSESEVDGLMQGLTDKQRSLLLQYPLFYDGGPEKSSTMDKSTESGANGQAPRNSPQDVGVVKGVLNRIYPIDQYHDDVAAQKDQRALNLAGSKEKQKEDLEEQFAMKSQSYLKDAPNFKGVPNIMNMTPIDAKRALIAAGLPEAQVPPELGALQVVASYGGPIEKYFPAKTYKGTPTISAQDAATYIKSYLNPNYSDVNYAAAHRTAEEYANRSVGKPGGQLNSIDTASQHIALLSQVANGLQNGQFPSLNAAANWLATQIGKPAPQAFNAVAQIVASEVSKVTGGGTPLESELNKFAQNLNEKQATAQIKAVVDDYINLMQGRLGTLNNDYKQTFNKDVRKMTPSTAKIFGEKGYYVPGWGTPLKGSDGQLYFTLTGDDKDAKPWTGKQ